MTCITPYLYYEDAGAAIEFMEEVFGFEIKQVFHDPKNNQVLHATVRTEGGKIFVGPGMNSFGTCGTPDPNLVTSMTYVYVDNVDTHYARTKKAGVKIWEEPHVHFSGNKQYTVSDPGGQRWTFAQSAKVQQK